MTRSIGNTIADSLQLSLGYGERMLTDVTAEQFARLASPGGETVQSNHAAFVYGHLSLYAPRILSELNCDAPAVPDSFQQCFSMDAQCVDDAAGTIYPAMDEVTEHFFNGYRAALEAFRAADDDIFQQPNPLGGTMAEKFPTVGSVHCFYVGGHMMIHMGPVSAWRRMLGLGPA